MPVNKSSPSNPNGRLTVGFLLASLHIGASRALWPGLLDAAERRDINLISFPGGRLHASNAFESQRNLIFDLASPQCLDGLITWASSLGGVLSPGETSAFHQRYQGLPMVSLAQFIDGLPTVALDSYLGMRALLKHLIQDHGYTRLAFVRGPEEHYYAQERYRAYLDALQAYDLPFIPELVTRPLRWESGAEAVEILLDERNLQPGKDFQVIVAVSDMLALWALKNLQARGFDIPGDVAVTGFNNSIEERLTTPPLTTVDQPFYHQGAKAVDVLLAQLAGETVPALMTLSSSLVVQQSCGCPSAAIAQAAYLPGLDESVSPQTPAAWFRSGSGRENCLAEMTQAAGEDVQTEPLLDALLLDLADLPFSENTSSRFLQTLEETLDQIIRIRSDLDSWNSVISALRKAVLPMLAFEKRAGLEALFGQARVVIDEARQRSNAYWQWQAERQAELLRETSRALLTTFDIHQLGDVLADHLPGLKIPSAFLVLYEDPNNPLTFSRLMMAYTERGRAPLDADGWHFATHELVPADFLPQGRRYSLVVEPLHFQRMSIGYMIFEIGPRNGDVYELVRDHLSSAIQGALLFQEIQQARLAAEKADHIKTRLLANVSHELRTPLNIILGYTQQMLDPASEAPMQSEIQHIQNHAEHQLRVINDLLDLSRAEIDELDLTLTLIDPAPLLMEAFESIAGHTSNPLVTWQLDLPERLPVIRADAVRLRQILFNLLANACKFTERGQVTLGADVAPPYIHFWVRDTGPGVSPEQQERIFEPFVTMEENRRITGGIGLGLSITRHLVALHGGKMHLDSQPGAGSTFHIHIPLPALEQDKPVSENTQPVLLLISTSGRVGPEIQPICQRQHLEICMVQTLEELDNALTQVRPLTVAWDLTDARAGDWNLLRRLRSHPSLGQIPFIFYGHIPNTESASPAPAVGLTSFVAKSPGPQSLLDAINALCPTPSGGSILIIDDDPQVRAMHQSIVTQGFPGCAIHTAADGAAGLAFMAQETPSLVLLDLVMPGLSGADVLDQMRANPRLRQVPVVLLSNKLLNLEDIKRLEHHAHVTLQTKGIWSDAETLSVLNRSLFGSENLPLHTSALVKRALAYFHQNYTRPLTRWEVAREIGISEDYLTRVFNRELEISPWDYLNRYRVLQAQTLLKTTHHSIGNIAKQVGFSDGAYFSRVFHKLINMSPQTFRETV